LAKDRTIVTHGVDPDGTETAMIEAIPGMEVCDFCSMRSPSYRTYEPGPIRIVAIAPDGSMFEDVSEDGWAACPTCEAFIEGDNFDGLLENVVRAFAQLNPKEAALIASQPGGKAHLREHFSVTLRAFWLAQKP
jgi:hypothetical protein